MSFVGAITGFSVGIQRCYDEFLLGFRTIPETNTILRKTILLISILVIHIVSVAIISPLIPVLFTYKVYSHLNMSR